MKDLSIKEFSDIVFDELKDLYENEPTLNNPNTESKFPIVELHTPLKSINKTDNAQPIKTIFQISITCWNEMQRKAMEMTDEVEEKLRKLNFVRTNTSPAIYDSILQKYGITITFEVIYNNIMTSFDFIR